MGEETAFYGVVVGSYDKGGEPASLRLVFPGTAPERNPFRFYPVFDSKEKAAEFVRMVSGDDPDPVFANLVDNIREIKRDEIPEQHYVLYEGRGLVRWGELLNEGK